MVGDGGWGETGYGWEWYRRIRYDPVFRRTKNSKMASKKQVKSQEQVIAGFQELRQQQRNVASKISELEMDMKEHE